MKKRAGWRRVSKSAELAATPERINRAAKPYAALTPILETLPQSDELPHSEETWRWKTGGRFMNNVSHYTASTDVTATGCSGGAKSAKSPGAFDTALQASVFDDQQAFLAALWMNKH